MPSSMIHLLAAKKVYPDYPVLFFIGNVVPDATDYREFKDKTHLRDIHDRESALDNLATRIPRKNLFEEGVLLHLFLDWKWDTGPMQAFIRSHGDDWFLPYREEIGQISALLFHRDKWFGEMWREMMAYEPASYMAAYTKLMDLSPNDIDEHMYAAVYFERNYKFHTANPGRPKFYTRELIEEFTDTAAKEYVGWRKQ